MTGRVIRSYVRLFEDNRMFNVLNVTSRLISVCIASFIYVLTQDGYVTFASLFIGVLGVDLIFFILQKRESQFKSALFFEKNKTTPKVMNRYMMTMLFIRLALMGLATFLSIKFDNFTPTHLVDAMIYYAIISYTCNFFLKGLFVKFDPQTMSDSFCPNGFRGAPGFNRHGIYTGSPTAIGGITD